MLVLFIIIKPNLKKITMHTTKYSNLKVLLLLTFINIFLHYVQCKLKKTYSFVLESIERNVINN